MAAPAQTQYKPLAERRCSAAAEACIHPISRVTQISPVCCLKYPAVPSHTARALFSAGPPPLGPSSPERSLGRPQGQQPSSPLRGCVLGPWDTGHCSTSSPDGRVDAGPPCHTQKHLLCPRPPGPWPSRLSAETQLKDSMSLRPQGPAPGRRSLRLCHQPNCGCGCVRPGDAGCPVTHHDMGF